MSDDFPKQRSYSTDSRYHDDMAKQEKPMSHMEEVERRSKELYKAPRVSLDDIKANIEWQYNFTAAQALTGIVGRPFAADAPESLLSICLLVTKNGFTVVGKSAPASPENFDPKYGADLAYEDAVKQLWPLMGYNLRQKLHEGKDAKAAG